MDLDERMALRAKRRRQRLMLHYLTLAAILFLVVAAVLAVVIPLMRHRNDPPANLQATDPPVSDTEVVTDAPTTEAPTTEAPTTEAPPTQPPTTEAPTETQAPETEPPADESWQLILVNKTHPIPEGYTVTLKELRNGHHVDERIYPELQQMFDDAREAGVFPLINESYRTTERQQQIMDSYIADYEAEGMGHEAAVEKALEYVAVPGTSEHELGLALDIIAEYEDDSSGTWQWLLDNSWRYGFILRYPADKVEITGIAYEPWHFRYVGKQAAQEITEAGLCLEEYLKQD